MAKNIKKMENEVKDMSFAYDKAKDVSDIPQYGFVDLVECYENNAVPSDVNYDNLAYNDIELDKVGEKPTDVFDSFRRQEEVSRLAENGD